MLRYTIQSWPRTGIAFLPRVNRKLGKVHITHQVASDKLTEELNMQNEIKKKRKVHARRYG